MNSFAKQYRVEIVAACVSVLLSLWLIYSDNVINGDGILYLKSAEAFANGNWQEGVDIYRWPLYAALIGAVHHLTGIETDVVAYALNTALYAVLVWAFLSIVKLFGADRRTLWLAAIFVLALPSLNSYRAFVIRDIGYWAFYLLGLLALFRFQLHPRLYLALGFGLAMTIATLFRIEGIAFLLCMPFVLLWRPQTGFRETFAQFAKLNTVLLIDAIALAVWFGAHGPDAFAGRLLEPWHRLSAFAQQVSGGLLDKADALGQSVLNKYSDDFALSGVIVILLVMLLTYIAKGLSPLGVFAAAYAWVSRAAPLRPELRRSLTMVIALNVVVLIVFIASMFFLTGRFVISLTLTLSLLVPFGLNRLYERWQDQRKRRWETFALPVATVLLLVMVADSLWSFGTSKTHLKEAGLWLRVNTPSDARLYSESPVVGFYAHKTGDEWRPSHEPVVDFERKETLQAYDYAAIVLKRGEALSPPLAAVQPIREFKSKANDRVVIFKIEDLRSTP